MRSPASLYETDFLLWLEQQSAALGARQWKDLDVRNLLEELEGLATSRHHELRSRMRVLLQHLLKMKYQPAQTTGSWRATVRDQGAEIALLLEESPSLRRLIPQAIAKEYPIARRNAADEAGMPAEQFPKECPVSLDEILRDPSA
jgi:Domain of unknown function DUF29